VTSQIARVMCGLGVTVMPAAAAPEVPRIGVFSHGTATIELTAITAGLLATPPHQHGCSDMTQAGHLCAKHSGGFGTDGTPEPGSAVGRTEAVGGDCS
jgi:hypothetical protein